MNELGMLKELRDKTGAGIGACKKAITEANGNLEKALEILRKNGLASAQNKSSRVTSEGLVAYKIDKNGIAIIELNCETDFVARNEKFQELIDIILNTTLVEKTSDLEKILEAKCFDCEMIIREKVMSSVGMIGENIQLSKIQYIGLSADEIAGFYVHNCISQNQYMGKIAVVVIAKTDSKSEKISQFLKKIAMHIAATNPVSVDISSIDPIISAKEMEIYTDQAKATGKPIEIAQKIAEGRMKKFYEESVLLEQILVTDGKSKVSEAINVFSNKIGSKIEIRSFVRIQLGTQ